MLAEAIFDYCCELPVGTEFCVTPDYFKVMGIHLIMGRVFTELDTDKSPMVIVGDQRLANLAFPGENWRSWDLRPPTLITSDPSKRRNNGSPRRFVRLLTIRGFKKLCCGRIGRPFERGIVSLLKDGKVVNGRSSKVRQYEELVAKYLQPTLRICSAAASNWLWACFTWE
jgi:hypothetical protein